MCSITQNIQNIVLAPPTRDTIIKSNCCKKGHAKGTRV